MATTVSASANQHGSTPPPCNPNNSIYDTNMNTCVVCRDLTVRPVVSSTTAILPGINTISYPSNFTAAQLPPPMGYVKEAPAIGMFGTAANEPITKITQYLCKNNSIKTYDKNNAVISQTCDSGETFDSATGTCSIYFQAR
jgi:hypothetical protein